MKVRFAPSPTGYLHVGNARIAVANALFAGHTGARFLLRLDDTDLERSRPEFEEAIQRGIATVISQAKGFVDAKVHKGIESPERYVLTIHWQTLENHTVDFRGGPLFPQWRAIVGTYFAKPPVVEHFELAVEHG